MTKMDTYFREIAQIMGDNHGKNAPFQPVILKIRLYYNGFERKCIEQNFHKAAEYMLRPQFAAKIAKLVGV